MPIVQVNDTTSVNVAATTIVSAKVAVTTPSVNVVATLPVSAKVAVNTPALVLQLSGMANQGPPGATGATGPQGPPGGNPTVADSITGTGASGSPLKLVNDSATPGNSMLYGTNGSGVLGWYAQAGSTGADSITGTTTLTLVNDSATPGNLMVYSTDGSGVRGWHAISGLAIAYSQLTSIPAYVPTTAGSANQLWQGNSVGWTTLAGQDSITGNGVGSPFQLVNDSATPGNSKLYGTNGSGVLGWYAQPTVGTLTTSDSITGGGAMSGNLTITLVGDVVSPGNNYLYGTNGSGTRGWYGVSSLSIGYSQLTSIPAYVPTTAGSANQVWQGNSVGWTTLSGTNSITGNGIGSPFQLSGDSCVPRQHHALRDQ